MEPRFGHDFGDVRVDGGVTANGGANKTDNNFQGGYGGVAYVRSDLGNASVNGTFALNGGAGRTAGGHAGFLYAESNHTSTSGTIAAGGGSSAFTAEGSGAAAGDGGFVDLESSRQPTLAGASVSLPKGTGGDATADPAVAGLYIVDGVVISSGGEFPDAYYYWLYD